MFINIIIILFFVNCWFIVDSTQYMRYLDLPSLMMGRTFINHRQSAETWHPTGILAQLVIEPARTSIGAQLVDIGSTCTTTISIRPRTILICL